MNEFVEHIEEKLSDQSLFTSTTATTASAGGDDGIYLGTVHSSKGREWQHVYLIDADDQTYTSYRTRQTAPDAAKEPAVKKSGNLGQTAEEDEEELGSADDSKNLLYVACSRAKSHLTIAYAGNPPPAPATTDPTSNNNTTTNTATNNNNTNITNTNRREISRYLRPLLKWKATFDKEVTGCNSSTNTTGTSKRSSADQETLEHMNTWLVVKKVHPSTLNSSSSTNHGSDSVLVGKTSIAMSSSSAIRQVSSFQVPPHRPPSAGNNSTGNSQGSFMNLSGFQRASSFHSASSPPTPVTTSHSSTTVASTSTTAATAHVSSELTRVLPTMNDKHSHPPSKRTKTEITAPASQPTTEISRSKSISDHFRPISGSFKTAATLCRGTSTTTATHTNVTDTANTTVSHEGEKVIGEGNTSGDGGKENNSDKNGQNSVWDF